MTMRTRKLDQGRPQMCIIGSPTHAGRRPLFQRRRDSKYLDTAMESFRRAMALSPSKAGSHTGLSLCLSSADRLEEAVDEIRVAQSLYPSSTHLQSISRMMGL